VAVLELLTGTGLALSAGLNAYIPLLVLGILHKYTPLVALPDSWLWLTEPTWLGVLGALLVIETVADKLPSVDHLNDIVQTVVRPTAGGMVFVASAGADTYGTADGLAETSLPAAVPIGLGVVLALSAHLVKALARPVVNLSTAGTGAPVMSVVEDIASSTLAVLAILVPVFVVVFVGALVAVAVTAVRQRRRHRRRLIVPPRRSPT
jgi:hypothetical protein